MKKVLMLIALLIGTTVMMDAQVTSAKTPPSKEMKQTKKVKTAKKAEPAKMEPAKAETKKAPEKAKKVERAKEKK